MDVNVAQIVGNHSREIAKTTGHEDLSDFAYSIGREASMHLLMALGLAGELSDKFDTQAVRSTLETRAAEIELEAQGGITNAT